MGHKKRVSKKFGETRVVEGRNGGVTVRDNRRVSQETVKNFLDQREYPSVVAWILGMGPEKEHRRSDHESRHRSGHGFFEKLAGYNMFEQRKTKKHHNHDHSPSKHSK